MRCRSVRLLLVAMLATHQTDFESFANALGALPNQPPVPMECVPSPSPIDMDAKAIVQQVVDVLLKHSPSPAAAMGVRGQVEGQSAKLLRAGQCLVGCREKEMESVDEKYSIAAPMPQVNPVAEAFKAREEAAKRKAVDRFQGVCRGCRGARRT